jgi:hypothetical protein
MMYNNDSSTSLKPAEGEAKAGLDSDYVVKCQRTQDTPSPSGTATVSMCSPNVTPTAASAASAFGLQESAESAHAEEASSGKSGPNTPKDIRWHTEEKADLEVMDERRATLLEMDAVLSQIAAAEIPEMEEQYPLMKAAQALYPYAAQEEDELQLQAGERVFLLGLSQPEWYVAVRSSVSPPEIGLVPQNYVALL